LLRQVWNRGFGAPLTLKEFHLDRAALVQETRYQTYEIPVSETRVETSSNWSGAYITANRDKHFLQIWGVWTVPAHLRLPPPPFQGLPGVEYRCATWIGLDGQRLYFDSSLPQIGTSSWLTANGSTAAEAWTQWWARGIPNAQPQRLGLTVAPGNQVLAVLTAWDAQSVIFVMVNLSDMTAMAVKGTAPTVKLDGTNASPDIAGATAEWIVERPAIPCQPLVHGRPPLYNFPDYGHTEFDLCVAVEADSVDIFSLFGGLPQDLQGERLIRMFDVLHNPERTAFISMPRKLSDTTVCLHYGSF
jgi:Peptidase A4 family